MQHPLLTATELMALWCGALAALDLGLWTFNKLRARKPRRNVKWRTR